MKVAKLMFAAPLLFAIAACAAEPAAGVKPIEGIGPVGEVKRVETGYGFTEGPAADGKGSLFFTDIPNSRVWKLDSKGELSIYIEPSGHANGLMFDSEGRMVLCQMDGQLARTTDKKQDNGQPVVETIAGEYNGKRFNAPNDLVIDQTGGIYFTDPRFRAPEPWPQGKEAVYYRSAEGEVTRLLDNLPAPNGVILSPDEKTLYVIPSRQADMMAYPVEGPGKLGEGKVFCTLKQPEGQENGGGDGLTVDTKGNLYITSALGVQVYSPKGDYLGVIAFPEQPSNCTFGGKGNNTLYVTARTSLYSAKMKAEGHVFPGAAE